MLGLSVASALQLRRGRTSAAVPVITQSHLVIDHQHGGGALLVPLARHSLELKLCLPISIHVNAFLEAPPRCHRAFMS
jgi:hypothetical protein